MDEETVHLLRKTFATFRKDEVAFTYVPKERIEPSIFKERFGPFAEVEGAGVTYSLTMEKLKRCFGSKPREIITQVDWVLNIPPFASRNITSIAITADTTHSTADRILSMYVPAHAVATAGTTVVHFVNGNAEWFKRLVAHKDE